MAVAATIYAAFAALKLHLASLASLLLPLLAALRPRIALIGGTVFGALGFRVCRYFYRVWHDREFIPNEAISDYVRRHRSGRVIRRILKGDGPYLTFAAFCMYYTQDVKTQGDEPPSAGECARAWCAYRALADRGSKMPHIKVTRSMLRREVLLNDNSGAGVHVALGPDGWSYPCRVPAPHF